MRTDDAQMDRHQVDRLLLRVGINPKERPENSAGLPKFDPFGDPSATDSLGRALAANLKSVGANVICVWEEPEDLVLGHVLGLAMGLRWTRCVSSDGLVALTGTLPPGARCVIATDAVRAVEPIAAMRNLITMNGGQLVGIAVLVSTPEFETLGDEATATVALARPLADTA
jgi:hypothetical protein